MFNLEIPPGIGEQPSSMRPSSARYSFGTSTRADRTRVAIPHTRGNAKKDDVDRIGRTSPGAIYDIPEMLGRAPTNVFGTQPRETTARYQYPDSSTDLSYGVVDSQKVKFRSARRAVMGTEPRDEIRNAEILARDPDAGKLKESPGAIYEPDDTKARPNSAPLWTMRPKTPINEGRTATGTRVGPNSYRTQEAIGPQVSSKKKTARSSSFGRASRFPTTKKQTGGADDGDAISSMGRQVNGRYKSHPSCSFGSSTREHTARTAFLQVAKDMGPRGKMAPPRVEHPNIAPQREFIDFGSKTPRF